MRGELGRSVYHDGWRRVAIARAQQARDGTAASVFPSAKVLGCGDRCVGGIRKFRLILVSQTLATGKSLRTPNNKEGEVKKFMFLHFGFEKPTPEIMEAWEAWFESISDKQIEQGGFSGGREISKSGTKDLPWNMESITGYNIIEAESLDAAEKLAQTNPFIASIRIYELRSM